MDYPKRRRLENYTDDLEERPKRRRRTLYEYDGPDNVRYRSPDPMILDRRRWRLEGIPKDERDRSDQDPLEEGDQNRQDEP